MRLENVKIEESVGNLLLHNVVDLDGHKVLSKGHLVRPEDLTILRAAGKGSVYAVMLEPGDVREDDAAARVSARMAGAGIQATKPSGGRVNFLATKPGFLRVNTGILSHINALQGFTLATLAQGAPLVPKKIVATLKTIGLALAESTVREIEALLQEAGPVVSVAAVVRGRVAVIFTGSANGRARVPEVFGPPIRERIVANGAEVVSEEYVLEEEELVGQAIERAIAGVGANLVLLAGETSIMDTDDTTPRGIKRAGGKIELYGAPVEPGNLLLLAYRGPVPVIGAPGCIKSKETNVVDLILPRLVAGEHISREDVAALAEGGLLVGS